MESVMYEYEVHKFEVKINQTQFGNHSTGTNLQKIILLGNFNVRKFHIKRMLYLLI